MCTLCGCTESRGCAEGCYWVTDAGVRVDLCSRCAVGAPAIERAIRAKLADLIEGELVRSQVEHPTEQEHASRRLGMSIAQQLIAPGPATEPEPLPLAWSGIVLGPSGDTEGETSLVVCLAPGDYSAALVLDDAARLSLGTALVGSRRHAEACTTEGCGEAGPLPIEQDRYGWIQVQVHGADGAGAWWCSPGCAYGAVAASTAGLHDGDPGAGDEYAAQVAEAAEAALEDYRFDDGIDQDEAHGGEGR